MTDDAARTAVLAALVLTVSLAGAGGVGAALATGPATTNGAATADAPVAAQTDGPGTADGLGAATFAQTGIDADRIVLNVRLAENGTARWQVDYRVELETDNDTAAFESLRADIADNESAYTASFRDRIERTAGAAENATGREMTIRNVDVATATESVQSFGTVSYSFQWESFATVADGRIEAGDALAGFFLERDSRLVLSWPDGYDAVTLAPSADDRRETGASWEGPVEFGTDGPQFVVEPAGGLPVVPIVAVVAVGLALVGGFVLYRRERDDDAAGAATGEDGAETGGPTDDAAGGADGTAAAAGGDATPDEELLSNEERVLRLLNDRGGRVKQQDVAGEFDWTDAKTSQVVNSLKDEGEIDVFRLGRENVLVLPEESDL